MMRRIALLGYCLLLGAVGATSAQTPPAEPAHTAATFQQLQAAIAGQPDTVRIDQLQEFTDVMIDKSRLAEAHLAAQEALRVAQGTGSNWWRSGAYFSRAYLADRESDFPGALRYYQQALDLLETTPASSRRYQRQARLLLALGTTAREAENWPSAARYLAQALALTQAQHLATQELYVYGELSNLAGTRHQYAQAAAYNDKALAGQRAAGKWDDYYTTLFNQAITYKNLGRYAQSEQAYREVLRHAEQTHDEYLRGFVYVNLPNTLLALHRPAEAERYAQLALAWAKSSPDQATVYKETYDVLARIKEQERDYPQALAYQRLTAAYRDTLLNAEKNRQLIDADARYQTKEKQAQIARLDEANAQQVRQLWLLGAGVSVLVLLAALLGRSNRSKLRANRELNQRNLLIATQRDELEQTLAQLRATQQQLVQREKLASLGAVTAGIAHEIQNPLNFVNNFSEVSVELLQELQAGPLQQLPEAEQAYAAEIVDDLTQNLQKITTHGRRADSIVKSMLQHSRAVPGERQPTDLNALADEYLRLAYHGLRAKSPDFNAALTTHFDPALEPVTVAAQELSQVLLNLFTNALQAVGEKQRLAGDAYQPEVTVSTQRCGNTVEIRVRDNGNGIPAALAEKIFEPFFTTKPTGVGTGLGLSLSYDIITKGHNGTLTVTSEEGEFAEFVVTLPVAVPAIVSA